MSSPIWVTIVVGLASGVIGTLISTLLRISHEREAELRSRMLEAADEFVAATTEAADKLTELALRRTLAELNAGAGHSEFAAPTRADIDAMRPLWDEASTALRDALRRLPRIRLLFGVDSQAAKRAQEACEKLTDAMTELVDQDEPRGHQADTIVGQVEALIDEFSRAARDDLRRGPGLKT